MRKKRSHKRLNVIEAPKVRANEEIDAEQVRVLSSDGTQLGVFSIEEALNMAQEQDLDLVEIASNDDTCPVCKVIDYSKYVFDTRKKKIQARKSQKQIDQKTIKFRPNTNVADYQIKLKKINEFLDKGARVKIVIWFRGREIVHQELGQKMLNRIRVDLENRTKVDDEPALEGRQLIMSLSPISSKN